MAAFQNMAIGIAVVLVAMACMVFGDWLARSKSQPDYYYCQNSGTPDRNEFAAPQEGAASDQEKARKAATERNHELCNQWRSAQAAEDATHVAWLQLWFGIAGLVGLVFTLYFTAQSARAAGDAAQHMERSVDVQLRLEKAFLHARDILADYRFPDHVPVSVKNYGKSQAILIDAFVDCAIGPSNLVGSPVYGTPNPCKGELLPEGESKTFLTFISGSGLLPVFDGEASAVVWGYVRYKDLFGRTWKYGFGLKSTVSVVVDHGDGSESDPTLGWSQDGKAYNYDREEPAETE